MLMLMTLLACADRHPDTPAPVASATAAEAPPAAQATTLPSGSRGEVAPEAPLGDAPAGVAAIRPLLQARHSEDVPSRATFDQHEGALEALVWLAENDGTLVVRERALLALASYASEPQAAAVCGAVLGDASEPEGARAAAAECLGNQDLSGDEALRKTVVAALSDESGRVGAASAMALAGVAEARAELEAASTNSALPEETQAAAARALKYK